MAKHFCLVIGVHMWLLDCGPTLASSTLHFVSHAKISACSVYT